MFNWLFKGRIVEAELAAKRKSDERFRALEAELSGIRMGHALQLADAISDIDAKFHNAHAAALARYRSES